MQTPNGLWRVEVVRRRGQNTRWYRIVRGDDDAVLDWLSISAVERILDEAGIDRSTLIPVVDGGTAAAADRPGTTTTGAA
jgi:hypothetical protein